MCLSKSIHYRGFTLENALAMLEDDNDYAERVENIAIFPAVNATSELTDEDSGEEEMLPINNLPGSQLQAPAEIIFQDNDCGPLEIFSKFFDDDLIELIVRESNSYAQQRNRKSNIESHEIKGFIGILILSGYIQVPRRRIFWEREKDGHNELVAEVLSRDRFEYILPNVHVANNENYGVGGGVVLEYADVLR
ncbi:hypothetical protein ILUMI_14377 [Ignelater luminosus]|uniref:PiggyBac transposable element-derived protein domain-containing protein n=1 Tax=Ignelater luminosus TaxID=2038154 RepID=A0A8K0GAI8_IGNLU|nr:hypothetical protein ILUMI_14377 [Ignelater luminosus]